MTTLTADQIRELNSYSIYLTTPEHPVFTLSDVLEPSKIQNVVQVAQTVSQSPNEVVAASYFMRRLGMFFAMQLYNLAAYDEIWNGSPENLHFGALEEFGNRTISTFADADDWEMVDDGERQAHIKRLLNDAHAAITSLRTAAPVSPLTLWENIFGFWLWQYHVLLSDPATEMEAREDLNILKDDTIWTGIANHSRFAGYLNGSEPSALLNTTVRKTCCFSKDVPGLMRCGFCPID
ncbi:hypothetical protein SporoP37_10570 [Sporosarcina sp. P37]|uniref:hypothetical protein n=1 Tax=unclassified Sporosarcina TaxID=2647733 RepID=UPI000A17DD5E|nr:MULTISPECIES: hypothetical protein [unclassified Sporosarcina]ARK26278.1 hypothetical protein SporoP37_10570 [Sporosarcina sp. P37]PID18215.1 hypothetical protein CSV62_09905 [Sporosarcina sp. P35]